MEQTRWNRAQTIFHGALEIPAPDRQSYLGSLCDGDSLLLAEVEAMLRADSAGTSLLDRGLPVVAHHLIDGLEFAAPPGDIGPYRRLELLGEGGMGVVWRAERRDTGAIVAIKLLLGAAFSPARRERFTREIRTLAKLNHPYVARLYDAGALEDGTPWFVMEYVNGERLNDFCRERGLTIAGRLRLFHLVGEAVQYAHSREIIHRDLKPSNILVEQDGTPKLLDFGIARQFSGAGEEEQTGLRFYSPSYAAPEWVRDGTVGFSTDIYSLGVILYQMLTGVIPQSPVGDDAAQPPKPSTIAPANSLGKAAWADLDVLCLRAIDQDPHQRYPSAEALLRDLDHYHRGEPLEARHGSQLYRTVKFIRRNRRPLLAAALTSAAVVALVIIFTVRLARARDAALTEAARSRRIQDLMVEMLGGAETNAAPSADLRVVTLLDEGAKKARSLDADPAAQAELYKTLGRMENMLGEYPKASAFISLALQKEIEAHGPQDIAVADTLVMQGIAFADNNDFARAEQTVRQGLTLARQLRPDDDAEVYYAAAYLGIVLCDEGKYKEAIAVLTPLSAWKPATDLAKQSKAEALTNLGIANYSMGRYEAAEIFDRQALALDKELYGSSHPRVAEGLANIGQNLSARQRYAEAESNYRDAVSILTAWYGAGHPDTATLTSILARTLLAEGKLDEAYPMLQSALTVQDRAYGGKDKQIAMTLDSLGRIELMRGHTRTAEADFRRGGDIDRSLLGDRNYQFAVLEADLADALVREDRPASAEPMLRHAVAVMAQAFPPGDPHISRTEGQWGHCLLALHRNREAQTELEAARRDASTQASPNVSELDQLRRDLVVAGDAQQQSARLPHLQAKMVAP